MRPWTRTLAQSLLGGFVLSALAFGAAQALGGQADRGDCQGCTSTPQCAQCCIEELGFEDGVCFPPNCICI